MFFMEKNKYADLHLHAWTYSVFNLFTNLSQCRNFEEIYEAVKDNPLNEWYIGVRFNQELLSEKRIPSLELLDRWFPQNPAVLVRTCLHLAVLNTKAMEAINKFSPDGVFLESDVFDILETIIEINNIPRQAVLENGIKNLQSFGIERFVDMHVTKQNIDVMADFPFYTSDFDLLDQALGLKIFLDGSLGARTAALTEEYSDDPGNYGTLNHSDEELLQLVESAHKKDKPVAMHAIGDRAIDQALTVLQKTRHPLDRIEHLQITRLDQVEALAKMNVVACIQPIFSKELPWATERVGKRIETSYAWGLMKDYGVKLIVGSDAPVDDVDPMEAAELVDSLSGYHHLDKAFVLQLYSQDNFAFYGWCEAC
jgi:predicted amidohydrolase YtcJ